MRSIDAMIEISTWSIFRFAYKLIKETKIFYRYYRINKFKPILYLPLKSNFQHVAENPDPDIAVFPILSQNGNLTDALKFKREGLFFPGRQMLSVHMKNLPVGSHPRSICMAIKPEAYPAVDRPLFIFSYGHREHDKAFGLYWGAPVVSGAPEDAELGMRLFYYCGIAPTERIGGNCDSPPFIKIDKIGEWIVFILTYDGREVCVYRTGELVYRQNVVLDTANTVYLNVGGFLHHIEGHAPLPKDIGYSMHGYIREFLIFDRCLEPKERKKLHRFVRGNIK